MYSMDDDLDSESKYMLFINNFRVVEEVKDTFSYQAKIDLEQIDLEHIEDENKYFQNYSLVYDWYPNSKSTRTHRYFIIDIENGKKIKNFIDLKNVSKFMIHEMLEYLKQKGN